MFFILFLSSCFAVTAVTGRGLSVIGGKGRGKVCADCEPEEFDPSELTWALVTLTGVTACYLAVCFCRCYPKLKSLWIDGPIPTSNPRNRTMSQRPMINRSNGQVQNIHFVNAKAAPGTAHFVHSDCGVKPVPGYPNRRRSSLASNRYHGRRLSGHRLESFSPHSPRKMSTDLSHVVPTNKPSLTPNRVSAQTSIMHPICCSANSRAFKNGSDHKSPAMKQVVFDYPVDRNGRLIPYPSGLIKPEVFSIKIPIDSANELLNAGPDKVRVRPLSRPSQMVEIVDSDNGDDLIKVQLMGS